MASTGQNHFQLFSLPVSFDVDQAVLSEQAREQLRLWHPDRYAGASDAEKRRALQMTGIINEALETLQKPLARAGHLLQLAGSDPDAFSQSDLGPEFLLEQMQLRDQLEEITGNEDIDALDAMKMDMRAARDDAYRSFSGAMESQDLATAKKLFHQLQFIEKLLVEINQTEEKLLDY